jgi:nitroreductase
VLERVLSAAAWSPSGSNLQPWNIYVVTGAPLAELKKRAGERVAAGGPWDEREYEMYPPELKSPYRERRSRMAKKLEGRKNLYLTGRSSLPERRVGATGSKAASAILDLSIAARRIAESEFRIESWACDHAAS